MKKKRFKSKENINATKKLPCVINNCECKPPMTPDHIITKGSGGGDTLNNLMPLCMYHHVMKGAKGIVYMADNYPRYYEALKERNLLDMLEYRRERLDYFLGKGAKLKE